MMTREKFLEYYRIQMSGVINMFVIDRVCELSANVLTKRDVLDIMANYEEYKKRWVR